MFEAKCSTGDVIVMTHARFGQMRVGRCLPGDLGYLGCGADVMYMFHERCSGLQGCRVLVGGTEMGERSTCMPGLLQYLEAGYRCRKGKTTLFVDISKHTI